MSPNEESTLETKIRTLEHWQGIYINIGLSLDGNELAPLYWVHQRVSHRHCDGTNCIQMWKKRPKKKLFLLSSFVVQCSVIHDKLTQAKYVNQLWTLINLTSLSNDWLDLNQCNERTWFEPQECDSLQHWYFINLNIAGHFCEKCILAFFDGGNFPRVI